MGSFMELLAPNVIYFIEGIVDSPPGAVMTTKTMHGEDPWIDGNNTCIVRRTVTPLP